MTEPILVTKEAKKGRDPKVLAGVVVAVLLMALVLPKVLFGGGDSGSAPSVVDSSASTSVVGSTPALPEGSSAKASPATVLHGQGNPFRSPVAAATGASSSAASGETTSAVAVPTTDTTLSTTDTTVPDTTVPDTTTTTLATSTTTTTATTIPSSLSNFILLDVFEDSDGDANVVVRIDDDVYKVLDGETFDDYEVVSIDLDDSCARFTNDESGDSSSFTLCTNTSSP